MRIALALAALAATGCATSLTAGHDGKVLEKGQLEVRAGTGGLIPVGVIADVVTTGADALSTFSEQAGSGGSVEIPQEKALKVATAAAAVLLSPPGAITDLTLRYGLHERVELGLSKAGAAWRIEGWGQIATGDWNVVGGLGLMTQSADGAILGLLDKLSLAAFGRRDLDVTVLFGRNWTYGSFYAGPKVMLSSFSGEGLLVSEKSLKVVGPSGESVSLEFDLGTSLVYGALVGGRIGWKYAYLTAELGVYGSRFTPRLVGQDVDLGGLIVYPALGVVVRY